jgi:DNA-binding NarL/FixJ family response regulator
VPGAGTGGTQRVLRRAAESVTVAGASPLKFCHRLPTLPAMTVPLVRHAATDRTVRVLVADDQVLVRAGIAALVGAMPGFACAGSVSSGEECLAFCDGDVPDILILDIMMPGLDGFAVARALRASHPALGIVFLSARCEAALVGKALAEGVLGFVSKDFVLDELEHALQCVAAGRRYASPQLAMAALQPAAPPAVSLSPRQQQVLRGIAGGRSNKDIARELGLSVKTVEFHRAELIQRLDLHDIASLTRYALQAGLAG